MNMSSWESKNIKRRRSSSFSPGHIVLEFNRTKKQKIFSHKLGGISFESKNINLQRDELISFQIDNIVNNSFKYENVGHTYSPSQVLKKDIETQKFPILSHGHPIAFAKENCSREGLKCAPGQGTDLICNPGKCIIGTLEHVRNKKWKYESSNTYSELPFIYYVNGEKEVFLHSVLRGRAITFADSGPVTLNINKPASKYSKILLPPSYYFSEDFIDQAISVLDKRLEEANNPPKSNIIGIQNRKDRFISSFVTYLYPRKSDGYISAKIYATGVGQEVKEGLVSIFSSLDGEWREECEKIIRESDGENGFEFISAVYDDVKVLFNSLLQITSSSFKSASLNYNKENISRPVYSRLPGIAEAYRTDPAFSEGETPAQWLTSGTDEFLSYKKDQISSFYQNYLDPETCSPLVLDWLAQHVGLFGPLWDERWDRKIKVALINNAFGWYDRESTQDIPGVGSVLTPKGEALSKFPFTQREWVGDTPSDTWSQTPEMWDTSLQWDGDIDNLLSIKLDEIETIKINGSFEILSGKEFLIKSYSEIDKKLSLVPIDTPKISRGKWNGLMESKGSLLCSVFLCSLFGLKSHSPLELRIINPDDKVIVPRNGLRDIEFDSPILMPYKSDVLQVGGEGDIKTNNFTNQIIAGVSRVTSIEDSKNVFYRMPFYYNRDGKSWDRANYIIKNWLPDNLNKRVQYAYLSANLWVVGDAFFEPDIVDESIYKSSLILTKEDRYMTTEDLTPLNY